MPDSLKSGMDYHQSIISPHRNTNNFFSKCTVCTILNCIHSTQWWDNEPVVAAQIITNRREGLTLLLGIIVLRIDGSTSWGKTN